MCAFFLHLFIAQLSKQFYWFKHLFISLRSANIFIFRMNSCSSYSNSIHNCQKLLTLYSANNIFLRKYLNEFSGICTTRPSDDGEYYQNNNAICCSVSLQIRMEILIVISGMRRFFTIKNWANKEEKKWTHPISMIVRLFEILETFLQRKLSYGKILDWIWKLFLAS